jgi:hypothetical protein
MVAILVELPYNKSLQRTKFNWLFPFLNILANNFIAA